MNEYFKFARKLALFAALFAVAMAIVVHMPTSYSHPLSAIIDKHRLLQHADSPKIVLIGGSGIYFGLDSQSLSEEFGCDVVNMGLFAGFGLRFLFETCEDEIDSGDVVVIIPEYDMFDEASLGKIESAARLWLIPISPLLYFRHLDSAGDFVFDISKLIFYKRSTFLKNLIHLKFDVLFKNGLKDFYEKNNEFGDAVVDPFERLAPEDLEGYGRRLVFELDEDSWSFFSDFINEINSRGATAILIYQAFPTDEYESNRRAIDMLDRRLSEIEGLIVPSPPSRYVFPYKRFTNTVNHLDSEGLVVRTALVVDDLSEIIGRK